VHIFAFPSGSNRDALVAPGGDPSHTRTAYGLFWHHPDVLSRTDEKRELYLGNGNGHSVSRVTQLAAKRHVTVRQCLPFPDLRQRPPPDSLQVRQALALLRWGLLTGCWLSVFFASNEIV
jgi:hypothetical protein